MHTRLYSNQVLVPLSLRHFLLDLLKLRGQGRPQQPLQDQAFQHLKALLPKLLHPHQLLPLLSPPQLHHPPLSPQALSLNPSPLQPQQPLWLPLHSQLLSGQVWYSPLA